MIARALAPVLVLAAICAACVGTPIDDHPCPPGGTKDTYATFGAPFFDQYCLRCHGDGAGYSSHSFTTVQAIRSNKDRIFINAAAGNDAMPPGPDGPTQDERNHLADWLACGAP
jgi:hypothetical protein